MLILIVIFDMNWTFLLDWRQILSDVRANSFVNFKEPKSKKADSNCVGFLWRSVRQYFWHWSFFVFGHPAFNVVGFCFLGPWNKHRFTPILPLWHIKVRVWTEAAKHFKVGLTLWMRIIKIRIELYAALVYFAFAKNCLVNIRELANKIATFKAFFVCSLNLMSRQLTEM